MPPSPPRRSGSPWSRRRSAGRPSQSLVEGTFNLNDNEALETLEAINSTINDNQFDKLVWTGDINADFVTK